MPGDVQTVAGIPTWLTVALQPPSAGTVCETALLIDDIRHGSKYAAAALTTASERVRSAQPGTRNHVLNAAAYSLGRLVGTGLLTTADTTTVLFDAARTSGLADAEITRTIRSGLTAGTQNPKPLQQ